MEPVPCPLSQRPHALQRAEVVSLTSVVSLGIRHELLPEARAPLGCIGWMMVEHSGEDLKHRNAFKMNVSCG